MFLRYIDFVFAPFRQIWNKFLGIKNIKGNIQVDINRSKALMNRGKKVAVVSCVGTDRVHRWRNWPAMIPAEAVTDGSLLVRQQSITAGRDINMFHIWVYQPK